MVHLQLVRAMATKEERSAKPKDESKSTRTSVSFPHELYRTLESIAKQKKVTVAWIIRDAAEKYVNEQ